MSRLYISPVVSNKHITNFSVSRAFLDFSALNTCTPHRLTDVNIECCRLYETYILNTLLCANKHPFIIDNSS